MKVQLRYFASVREALGRGSEQRDTHAATLRQLRDELIARGEPYAQALARRARRAHGARPGHGARTTPLRDGCEVAFFPPVTGG